MTKVNFLSREFHFLELLKKSSFFFTKAVAEGKLSCIINAIQRGEIAQLVEQGTENPCVPGSTPGLATLKDSVKAESFFYLSVLLSRDC